VSVRVLLFAAAVCAAGLLPPSRAAAQDEPSQSEMAAARQQFRAGLQHARAARWEEALESFERSWGIAEVPTTLLNLAGAQVQTGRLVAGAESYRRFLDMATSGRAARYRSQAEEALEEVEERIPSIVIEVDDLAEGDRLSVDDDDVRSGVVGVPFPLDPGEHVVTVSRGGAVVATETVTLEEGEERTVSLSAPEGSLPSVDGSTLDEERGSEALAGPEDDDDGGGVLASPLFWTGVGAVVVGGVVAALLISSRGGQDDLYEGNLGSGHVVYR